MNCQEGVEIKDIERQPHLCYGFHAQNHGRGEAGGDYEWAGVLPAPNRNGDVVSPLCMGLPTIRYMEGGNFAFVLAHWDAM